MRSARDAIQALPKPARERLRRHECGLCEIRLHSGFCGAIGPACTTAEMLKRAAACLRGSKRFDMREAADMLTGEG